MRQSLLFLLLGLLYLSCNKEDEPLAEFSHEFSFEMRPSGAGILTQIADVYEFTSNHQATLNNLGMDASSVRISPLEISMVGRTQPMPLDRLATVNFEWFAINNPNDDLEVGNFEFININETEPLYLFPNIVDLSSFSPDDYGLRVRYRYWQNNSRIIPVLVKCRYGIFEK